MPEAVALKIGNASLFGFVGVVVNVLDVNGRMARHHSKVEVADRERVGHRGGVRLAERDAQESRGLGRCV